MSNDLSPAVPPRGLPSTECLEAFGFHPLVARILTDREGGPIRGGVIVRIADDGSADVVDTGETPAIDLLVGVGPVPGLSGLAVVDSGTIRASEGALPLGAEVITAHQVLADGTSRCLVQGADRPGEDRLWGERRARTGRLWGEQCTGYQRDVLFRALGLATPSSALPVDWYWLAVWFADLVSLGPGCSVAQAARWHPAIDPRTVDELEGTDLERFVVRSHRQHARSTGWEGVRRSAAAGWLDLGWCPSRIADWLDEGSMGRWLADQLPWPDELLLWAETNLSGPLRRLAVDLVVLTGGPPDQ